MYVIAKVFENRPFNFQEEEDDATPDCSRKQTYGKRQSEFELKSLTIYSYHLSRLAKCLQLTLRLES